MEQGGKEIIWVRLSAGFSLFAAAMLLLKLLSGFDLVSFLLGVVGVVAAVKLLKRSKTAAYVVIAFLGFVVITSFPILYLFLIYPAMNGHINTPGLIEYIAIIYILIGGSCIWGLLKKETREILR